MSSQAPNPEVPAHSLEDLAADWVSTFTESTSALGQVESHGPFISAPMQFEMNPPEMQAADLEEMHARANLVNALAEEVVAASNTGSQVGLIERGIDAVVDQASRGKYILSDGNKLDLMKDVFAASVQVMNHKEDSGL